MGKGLVKLIIILQLKCVCYAISGSLGENCTMSSQCKTSNSRCVNNYCICSDDTIDDNGVEPGGSCKPKSDFEPRYALATIINFSAMKLEWLAPKEISLIKNFIVIYTKAFLYKEFNITVPKSYTILTSHCYAEHRGFSAVITKLSMSTLYHIKVQSVLYTGQRVGVDFFNYTRTTAPRIHMDRKPLAPLVNFWWDHRYCDYFSVTLIGLQDSYNYTIKTKKNKLTATGLKPGLSYEFTIVPYKQNIGGSVNHITFRLPPTPPGPPKNLRYKIFHNKVVELNWEEPSKSNGFIDFYFIHIHVNGEKLNNTVVTPFRAKSWTFTEYVPGKTYCFSVYSHNDGDYNGTKAAHICTNNGFKSDNEKLKAKNHENKGFIPTTVVLSVFVAVSIAIIISLIIKMKMLANELERCKRSHYEAPASSDTTYSTLRT